MITSFPNPTAPNFAGNASFQFAPYPGISLLPVIKNMAVTSAIQFQTGYQLLQGLSSLDKLNFDEQIGTDDNGAPVAWQITGFYPGINPLVIKLFYEMTWFRHIVLIKDQTNQLRLVGHSAPLIFTYSYNSGSVPGDPKGYTFQFAGSAEKPAPFYLV